MALEFRIEWEEAPGVRSPVAAATWARLEIHVGGHPVTRFWSERVKGVRTGVYGSVFPLARWMVRNWWHLLDEGIRHPEVLRGARGSQGEGRSWLERHNVLLARDGMAYPDLSIYREDEAVCARWVRDPDDVTTPGRFLGDGAKLLDRAEVQARMTEVVDCVLERSKELEDAEVRELRDDWQAVTASTANEPELCARLAGLGLDPYSEDLTESLEDLLSGDPGLPEFALQDLLAATTTEGLAGDLEVARTLLGSLPGPGSAALAPRADPFDPRPYRAGYERAEIVRRRLGLDPVEPVPDVNAVIERLLGVVATTWLEPAAVSGVEGAVHRNGSCSLSATDRSPQSRRFLLGRALHHWHFVVGGAGPVRLLTRAGDWQQSASRAFAAELLAPAAALSARLGHGDAWDSQVYEALAQEFQVSSRVIVHQIENHRLG
ncbi:MAG: hypothetical protein JW751_04815 [Polyangiaceae bacterium]|nr:hypothetical protein [Polyangiaceae bacterium]